MALSFRDVDRMGSFVICPACHSREFACVAYNVVYGSGMGVTGV